ncbi:MAG: oligosaccharide repeat unit polymerase, partial [Prevotella sp.]|nr:oligosaccharide repeat unit polymerase [Prevotella sp.]
TCICISTSRRIIITPQLLFSACFIPGSFYALFYVEKWKFNLANETLLIIIGGCSIFLLVSLIVGLIGHNNSLLHRLKIDENETTPISIEKWKLIGFIVLQAITVLWLIYTLMKLTGGISLSSAIYAFRMSMRTDDSLVLPRLLTELRRISVISGYLWMYLFLHGIVYKYKTERLLLLVNVILSGILSSLLGARTGFIQMLVAMMFQWYFLNGRKKGWKTETNFKYVFYTILLVFVLGLTFKIFGDLLGRDTQKDDYIAVYLSAELKNLDIFIRKGMFGTPYYNWQTLINVVNFFGNILGKPELIHKLDNPFEHINGHWLGNVKTTFYAFMYDGGWAGLIFFTVLMAIISQLSFRKAAFGKSEKINLNLVIYSYLAFTIAFSFFSNKFYEMLFSPSFLIQLIYLYILRWILLKVRIKHS